MEVVREVVVLVEVGKREDMTENIISFIEDIKIKDMSSFNEASTKQIVIMRLLYILGWDIFNIDDVIPEYSVGSMKVDYALKGKNKVFIEVKKIGEDLEKYQQQLLGYSFQEGVNLSILTNGITWWFYLPLREGDWRQRRFYTIDIFQQDSKEIALKFVAFISKENINNGDAIDNAESIYDGQQRSNALEDAIPKAWNRIIGEYDNILINLISDVAEKICGFRPDDEMVIQFLSKNFGRLNAIDVKNIKDSKNQSIETIIQPLEDSAKIPKIDYVGRSVSSFYFKGSQFRVKTWKNLLAELVNIIYSLHKQDFDRIMDINLKGRKFFPHDPNELGTPYKIKDTNIYVETKLSSNNVVRLCYNIIYEFGYPHNDLRIESI